MTGDQRFSIRTKQFLLQSAGVAMPPPTPLQAPVQAPTSWDKALRRTYHTTVVDGGLQSHQDNTCIAAIAQASGRNALVTTFKKTYTRFRTSASQTQHAASLATTVRWAIREKKRFQRFIDDLRGFNDSLVALFPDVGSQACEAMAAEINTSTDLGSLQVIEQAVGDLENGDEGLAEAASLRITEISQHTTSLATNDDDDDDAESSSTAIQGIRDVNMKMLTQQLEKLGVAIKAELKGSLQISVQDFGFGDHYGSLNWRGMENNEFGIEEGREREYVQCPYLAWYLMYASEKNGFEHGDFSHRDSEANRKFEGRFPGTRTVEGYGASFGTWARVHKPDFPPRPVFCSTFDVPAHTTPELIDLLSDLHRRKSLPWNLTNERAYEYLDKLLGIRAHSRMAPGVSFDNSMQVMDLLDTLNRSDLFEDLRSGGSLGAQAFPNFPNFLYQMVVAYELKLRLKDQGFGGINARVIAAMQAAERWVDGVSIKVTKGSNPHAELRSLVHERQVEGLVRFAELLAWPALGEMREFVEDAYTDMCAGMHLSFHLWDWLFGTMLPGKAFAFTIMSALVAATPSLLPLGAPRYYESGLVLENKSYWRDKWVMGRVLGGIWGVRAANGWVGPCPVPAKGSRERVSKSWRRVVARDTAFALPERIAPHADADESSLFSSLDRVGGNSSHVEWVRTIGDPTKWVVPVGPSNAPDTVELRALALKSIPREQALDEFGSQKGTGLSIAVDRSNTVTVSVQDDQGNETPIEDDKEPAQRAVLELTINGQPVSFTLYNNPIFIAAPRCIDGPHPVHERDLPKMQHILRVGQLSGHIHNDPRVLIIDATGGGECELAARAWCSEYGQHAIVKRGTGPCIACAVRAASAEGLGVGCVIWT
ncbi:heterokaryon incompatibility protein S [Dichotomopilus funicola]|uniref:Heterokaryon incompatibility protein S n=1 Tax=Dichotomopilus funicola TaxID=1934379 RepID=A0AAN6UYK7_9PEZI|nr:heterokaryon incompatibility protein S [Dichotomopilus funicola]